MNNLIISSLLILFICFHSIKTQDQQKQITSLELKINKTVFLVGDLITVQVAVDNLPKDKNVTITVKGKSDKEPDRILKCVDCSTRLFVNDRLLVQSNHLNRKIIYKLKSDRNQSIERYITTLSNETSPNHLLLFKWKAIEASKLTLYIETNLNENETDTTKTKFIEIGIIKSRNLLIIADIVGWSYFVFWLICFYPQVYLNYTRKSCIGLSIDYVILNFIGFLFYAVFNVSLYYIKTVRDEYQQVYKYSNIPVLTNDLVFSLHHFIVSGIIAVQCIFIYENGNQSFSRSCIISLTIIFSGFFILGYYVLVGTFPTLEYVYYFGFVKMFFTALKYVPQAYSNFKNKSTLGWSVSFNVYDMLGGISCILQMFILIHNYQDGSFISKNIAKTGIAVLTLVFDIVFLVQHFCLYGNKNQFNKNKVNYGSTQISCSKQGDSGIILFKESTNNVA